jgi:G3E family GTPase
VSEPLAGISTNIITGFLGAGKSTTILDLISNKPRQENWAILVNEFGEVGIDGGLLAARDSKEVFIREVPGGCMCCTAGLPMFIAMNMLLARARPQRLIIEPTGLGHPTEVMNVLASEQYRDVLDIHTTVTLVDARKIADERYSSHATFNEQLEIGDLIVANKSDLYGPSDFENLYSYLAQRNWLEDRKLVKAVDGKLESEWLKPEGHSWRRTKKQPISGSIEQVGEVAQNEFPPGGYIRLSNQGEGFTSHGWIFRPEFVFDEKAVAELLNNTNVERIKALLLTDSGAFGYNFAGDSTDRVQLNSLDDSRIEVIAAGAFPAADFEAQLLAVSDAQWAE